MSIPPNAGRALKVAMHSRRRDGAERMSVRPTWQTAHVDEIKTESDQFSRHLTDALLLDWVAENGAHRLGFDEIARFFACSQAALYRRFRGWHALMEFLHGALTETVDAAFKGPNGHRPEDLEDWWTTMVAFLRSRRGRAFLSLRPCASNGRDMAEVARAEAERLQHLTRWVKQATCPAGVAPTTVTRMLWSLVVLGAGEPDVERQMFEFAQSLVAARH
ncbi:MAG: hypothetical protein JNK82_04450 [Myxococcaceae bacterium]|nr:hypothetical protein [Myxococcaceae bacterium]